jgi:folate-binding protein YgfZ
VLAPDAVALRRLLAEQAKALEPHEIDELRIRSGIPAFPNEINERHNPWEARLDDSLSLTKGCYIGQEVIARLNTYKKVQRRLSGVTLSARVGPGDPLTKEEEVVGEASTVAGSRALAFIDTDLIEAGTELDQGTVTEWPMG